MKKWVKKTLANILLAGASIIPLKSQNLINRVIINPFVQPNDSSLNYYGSGDVNNNNKIDSIDYQTAINGLIGQEVPSKVTNRMYDRADVDGDGFITENDRTKIKNYVDNKDSTGLPGRFWNYLDKTQKKNWIQKMINAEKKFRMKNLFPSDWLCGKMSVQTEINFKGYKNVNDTSIQNKFSEYDFSNNGRFNLPVYNILITGANIPGGHIANCILIGKDPKNFEDLHCFDPTGMYAELKPTTGTNMPQNSNIKIKQKTFSDEGLILETEFLEFQLNNLTPELVNYNPYVLVLKNPLNEKTAPELELTGIEKNKFYKNIPSISYKVHDGSFVESKQINPNFVFDIYDGVFLDSCWYKLNGNKTEIPFSIRNPPVATYSSSGSINTTDKLVEGKNTLEVYASNIAGNKKDSLIEFYIDTKKPVLSSEKETLYTNKSSVGIPWKVSDENRGKTSFFFDGKKKYESTADSGEFNINFGSEDIYNIYLRTEDLAGNVDSMFRRVVYDVTDPLVEIIKYDIPQINDSEYPLEVEVADNNPDKVFYSINNQPEKILSGGFIQLEDGMNKVVVRAIDKAGNSGKYSKDSVTLFKTGIKNYNLSENVQIYPNPVRDYSNVKINTNKLEKISTTIYDNIGRVIEKKNENCSGECNYQFDMTDYPKGVYVYKVSTSDGKSFTQKVLKE